MLLIKKSLVYKSYQRDYMFNNSLIHIFLFNLILKCQTCLAVSSLTNRILIYPLLDMNNLHKKNVHFIFSPLLAGIEWLSALVFDVGLGIGYL